MLDLYKKPLSGHIIVECLDKLGNVVDKFENHNLIMETARISVSSNACDIALSEPLNKFVLGTNGHISGDYLTPKTEVEGFISSRTELFSEELNNFTYPITFTNPGVPVGACTITSELDTGTTIALTYANNDVKYTIEIPEGAANGTGVAVYTEAALYAGSSIFSMKCFPGKIKDNTVSLRVIWTIKF